MNQPKEYDQDLKSDPSGFRQKARKHQSDYRQNVLQVDCSDPYGTRISESDGFEKGLNFYEGLDVRSTVLSTFKNFKEQLHSNLLRSEHIPFNFFLPIDKFRHEQDTIDFINHLIPSLNAASISKLEIEFAPPKATGLSDNTSFDTYIETVDSNKLKTGIGIEVKYTERSYPYGETEKLRMFDGDGKSLYHAASDYAGIPKENVEHLRKEDLKQFWRNYLLGVTMFRAGLIDSFVSVHLYPEGNTYQATQAEAFKQLLSKDERFSFLPLTYEAFIKKGRETLSDNQQMLDWLQYLEDRYIVR